MIEHVAGGAAAFASGGDNLAVYVPFFASVGAGGMPSVLIALGAAIITQAGTISAIIP